MNKNKNKDIIMDKMMFELDYFLKNSNVVKELVIQRLLKDGVLNDAQASEYTEKWNVIIIKPSWFEKWRNKFRGGVDNDNYVFKFVKFED